uniref:Transcription elongation regulator 1-like protein n=1 Tax=Nothoprocta perdicaria TaxID=30464 RepID=A0A8C6ZLP4_NOTPE
MAGLDFPVLLTAVPRVWELLPPRALRPPAPALAPAPRSRPSGPLPTRCRLCPQWVLAARAPLVAFAPSSGVELVPLFPPALAAPVAHKRWVDKRRCKIYLNNAFALDSAWIHPEESGIFQGSEKPLLMTNQVAMAVARPATASRPLPTVVLAPQLIPGGCRSGAKAAGAAAGLALPVVSVEPEPPRGPGARPCRLLALAPLRVPLLAAPLPGTSRAPAVSQDTRTCDTPATPPTVEDGSTANGNKPVASTPVPGSPWCVVWTGDDRVFFFNPTMQLSVWEKPMDLKDRGDINRIIEDPPHKRKLETSATDRSISSCPGDENDDLSIKTKRNKTEDSPLGEPGRRAAEEKSRKAPAREELLPREERVTHFRDMLLERGVSAFSTWEKELHKIVFDPRYLLLNSEERKQIFEQFVKARIREEYKEKKNKLLLAKEEFKKLLEESKLTPRTTFKEFAEKYGRDQRFRLVQKKKDQEHFFNQFMLILKKRDKENRIRLRKMR